MSYENPEVINYRFAAATISGAAVIGRFISPAGKKGRVVDIATIVTTGVTVAASTVQVGLTADPNAYATLTVPISAANAGANGAVAVDQHEIPADTVVDVYSGGECTAGACDINVTIAWY